MSKEFDFSFVCSFIFTLQLVYVCGYYGRPKTCSACDPSDPIPLRRIDLDMIKGTWRSQYQRNPKKLPVKNVWSGFNLIIGTPFENGSTPAEATGRSLVNCECRNMQLLFYFTGVKNNYRTNLPTGNGIWEFQFLDLIGSYLLAQNCVEFDANRRCTDSFITILSRANNDGIPLKVLKRLNQSTRKTLCLDVFEDLLEWPRGIDCPTTIETRSSDVLSLKCEGFCKRNVTVIYEVRNRLRYPAFYNFIKVTLPKGDPFIRFMERAADIDPQKRFNFSADYFSGLGYSITTINRVTANYTADRTWWQFLLAPDHLLPLGVSSYEPKDGQHIIFNFTQDLGQNLM